MGSGTGSGLGTCRACGGYVQSRLQPGVRFYLTVLLTIAAANSLFILVSPLAYQESREKARPGPSLYHCPASCCTIWIWMYGTCSPGVLPCRPVSHHVGTDGGS